jgi:hypothetical protein
MDAKQAHRFEVKGVQSGEERGALELLRHAEAG